MKVVFEQEFPLKSPFPVRFKAGFDANGVTFFRKHDPLKLYPCTRVRNSLQGGISIQCREAEYSSESILHITISPPKQQYMLWGISGIWILSGIPALYNGVWQMLIPLLLMPVFLWIVLAACRTAAENDIPKIRQSFENTLHLLEQKYQNDNRYKITGK